MAGDGNYELNIGIDWSDAIGSTDRFLQEVSQKIGALQSRLSLPTSDPNRLDETQFAQEARTQVEVAKRLIRELEQLGVLTRQQSTNLVGRVNREGRAAVAAAAPGAERAYVDYAGQGAIHARSVDNANTRLLATMRTQADLQVEAVAAAQDYVDALKERLAFNRALAAFDRQQLDKSETSVRIQAEINAAERQQAAAVKAATADVLRKGGINRLARLESEGEVFDRDLRSRIDLTTSGALANDPRYAERLGRTAANERSVELRKQLEFEKQISKNLAENVRLVAEETQLRRLRMASERAASTDFRGDPLLGARIAKEEADALINDRINRSRVNEQEAGFFAGDSGDAIATREREAVTEVDKRIANIKQSVEIERLYASYLEQNVQEVLEEFQLRHANNARLKRLQQDFLAGDTDAAREIREDEAATAVATERIKLKRQAEAAGQGGTGIVRERAEGVAIQEVGTLQRRLIVAREALGSAVTDAELMEDRVRLNAQVVVAERQLKQALDKETSAALVAAGYTTPAANKPLPRVGAGRDGGPSFFQRAYSRVNGGDALDAPSGRKFLGSRALSTAAYGLSGGLLYGSIQAIGDTIRQSEELQAQLNVLESQFNALDRAGELPQVKESIFEIARSTGVATDQIAELAVQFTGAFKDPAISAQAQQVAAELAVIGDLAPAEIFNDLIAGARAFAEVDTPEGQLDALERLGDLSIQARNLSGVAPKELLDFLGRVGPSARAASVSLEELNAIGAAVLQGSGLSGSALGDQFNRVLTDFQKNAGDLYSLVQQTPALADALDDSFDSKLFAGDASAILDLVAAFQGLTDPQLKRNIISELGSRREGQTIAALFENASTALEVYGAANEAAGTRASEFQRKQETLRQQLKEFRVEIEQLGLAIFNSGLGDGLQFMVQTLTLLAGAVKEILSLFHEFNDATGGLAIKLAVLAGTLKVLGLGMGFLGKRGLPTTFGGLRGLAAGAILPGGLFSPQVYGGAGGPGPYGIPGAPTTFINPRIGEYRPGIDARYGVRGLAAGNAGRFAAGAAGFAANVAPTVATLAVLELAKSVHDERAQGGDNEKYIEGIIADRVARGDALEDIQKDIDGLNTSYSAAERIGFTLQGTKTPDQEALDALQNARAEGFVGQQVRRILELDNEGIAKLIAAAQSKDRGETVDPSGLSDEYIEQARKTFDDYLADTDDDDLNRQVEFLLTGASGVAGLTSDLQGIADGFTTKARTLAGAADALDKLADPERQLGLQDLLAEYETGSVPVADVEAALREQITLLSASIDGFRAAGNLEAVFDLLNQRKQFEEQLKALILEPIRQQASVRSFINSIKGEDAQAEFDVALRAYREIAASGAASPEEQLDAVQDLLGAQRDAFMEYVDAAPDAAERLRRLQEGFDISPEVQRALATLQVSTGTNKDVVARLAVALKQSVEATSDRLVDDLLEYGNGAIDIQRLLLTARRAELLVAKKMYTKLRDRSALKAVNKTLEAVDAALAGLPTLDVDVPAAGEATDVDVRAAQEAADREAEQKAEDARAKALAYSAALRDLEVARSHDDPIVAAGAAERAAREQIATARDATEAAEGQAALIRAQRGQVDAILALADAQSDILIAMFERTGDTVGAADEAVKKIDRQLARVDLNPTERKGLEAERINAVTAAGDARLSEAEAEIDFNLSMEKITKNQAIAQLKNLLKLADSDDEIRSLQLKIKGLEDDLGQNYQFNLPSDIGLPTLYEARRLDQTPTGQGYNTDSRVITINFTANNVAEAEDYFNQIVEEFSKPTRFGTAPRPY